MIADKQPTPQARRRRLVRYSLWTLLVFAVIAAVGIGLRIFEATSLKAKTAAAAFPIVSVLIAEKNKATEDIVLPGTVSAWHEAIIYARTGGYLKYWNVDIGAHVKTGAVLAEIDAPDLDAQFHQAQADLATAAANNRLAQLTAKRYVELLKSDSVSKQQADTAVATADADQATVNAQTANLDHLQQEEDFKTIVAPFDGVITQRNADVGTLINGGSTTNATGQDVFHIADASKLRVYVQVPENEADAIHPGMIAALHFPQNPQQFVEAKLARTAEALDPVTRSLQIELDVDNDAGLLMAGGYVEANLHVATKANMVIVPVNCLLFRDVMTVAVIKDNHAHIQPIKIGRDFGQSVEVTDGVSPGDRIVVNPPDSLQDGEEVRIAPPRDVE